METNETNKEIMTINNSGIQVDRQKRELTPAVWSMIERIAQAAYRARMYRGITNPETAAMIILKGYELGLGITASFEFIVPILGKYELIPRGALALLLEHPMIEKVEINRLIDANGEFLGYETTIARKNGFSYTSRFTIDDAKRAGLIKPDSVWIKYQENMCLWRSVGFAADVVGPDITSGMTNLLKMPEEYGVELDDKGNIIDTSWKRADEAQPEQQTPNPIPENENGITLENLVERYGGEKIIIANGGQIPATQEELNKIAKILEEE